MSNYYHDAQQEHNDHVMFAREDYIREAYGSSEIDGDAEAAIEDARWEANWASLSPEEKAAIEAKTLKAELEEAKAWQAMIDDNKKNEELGIPF